MTQHKTPPLVDREAVPMPRPKILAAVAGAALAFIPLAVRPAAADGCVPPVAMSLVEHTDHWSCDDVDLVRSRGTVRLGDQKYMDAGTSGSTTIVRWVSRLACLARWCQSRRAVAASGG